MRLYLIELCLFKIPDLPNKETVGQSNKKCEFHLHHSIPVIFWHQVTIQQFFSYMQSEDLSQDNHYFHVLLSVRATATAKEISSNCRQLIVDHATWCSNTTELIHPKPCIHGDILDMLPPESFNPKSSFMKRLYAIDRAKLNSHQYCFTHNRQCSLGLIRNDPQETADFDFSGLPCPDMSPAGKNQREEGQTSTVFAVHAKYHIAKQTLMLLIENVPDQGVDKMFQTCLMSIRHIY